MITAPPPDDMREFATPAPVSALHHGIAAAGRSLARTFDAFSSFLAAVIFVPLSALATRRARRFLLALVILDIPFSIGKHLDYQETAADLGGLAGFDISVTTIALLGLYLGWILQSLSDPARSYRERLHFSLPLLVYITITGFSISVAGNTEFSLFEIVLLVQMFFLYLYIANNVRSREDLLFIVALLLIALVVEGLIMIGIRAIGHDLGITGFRTRIDTDGDIVRVGGTVGSPNNAGAYLAVSMAIGIGVLFSGLGGAYKFLAVGALGLGSIALILTFSRGAWTAFAIAVSFACFRAWRIGRLPVKLALTVGIIIAFAALLFQDAIATRISGDDRGAAYARVPLTKLAFRVIADNPVLGVGANNFERVLDQYVNGDFRSGWLYTVHNKYLLVWAETGTPGLLAFLLFLFTTVRHGWRCTRIPDRVISSLAIGFVAGIIGLMVHMLVDVFRGRPLTDLLWVLAGLITAMVHIQNKAHVLSGQVQPAEVSGAMRRR
jgi:putative inorganic carbon (HCO3(-)) transporter